MKEVLFCLTIVASSIWHFVDSQSCETWVSVEEDKYNRTLVDITDENANLVRPLGYKMASYDFEGAQPCVKVESTGGNGRHIELKIELDQEGTLMVKNNINSQVLTLGSGQTFSSCAQVPGSASSVQYTFYCMGANCEGGTKFFWYRWVVEQPDQNGAFEENWCDTRDSSFPRSLIVFPSIEVPDEETEDTKGKATSVKIAVETLLFTFVTFCLLFM